MVSSIISAPFVPLLYIRREFRQDRDWSYRQALTGALMKACLSVYVALRLKPKSSLSLKPCWEGDLFVTIEPAPTDLYTGITVHDKIHPETIAGTWFPSLYQYNTTTNQDKHVILHFHGGSYIIGDGRTSSSKHLANSLLENTPTSHIFSLQYRLARNRATRFPAQLQDAIAAYSYLIHTLHFPTNRIVISGDSAGGHLALSLLRYIADYDDETVLPPPTCCWLFSPWCDVPGALKQRLWDNIPNTQTDYIPASFAAWGAKQIIGNIELSRENEGYLAPIWHPFVLPSPILIVSGGREVMCQEHDRLARYLGKLQQNEERVKFFVHEMLPHDILMVAWLMGFQKEADQCASKAGNFLSQVLGASDDSEVPCVAFERQ
ncbi:Alpha/beta hydrolase fold-3 [Penicillium soppii]|uniref:Alpha/beta hydrolase fold-3 n=1 Tax=Penicillium soppii TaxID=69789 RepID=UPI00254756A8|nr:Alpha/beta hydrolase fold-3 [Penicillium soppii]KAJ5874119.1 Alpha/beta hydrolase fold-3 [Penicillium soppii]